MELEQAELRDGEAQEASVQATQGSRQPCAGELVMLPRLDTPEPNSGCVLVGPFKRLPDAAGSLHVEAAGTLLTTLLLQLQGTGYSEPELQGVWKLFGEEFVQVWRVGDTGASEALEDVAAGRDRRTGEYCRCFTRLEVRAWSRPLCPEGWKRADSHGRLTLAECMDPTSLSIGEAPVALAGEAVVLFEGTITTPRSITMCPSRSLINGSLVRRQGWPRSCSWGG